MKTNNVVVLKRNGIEKTLNKGDYKMITYAIQFTKNPEYFWDCSEDNYSSINFTLFSTREQAEDYYADNQDIMQYGKIVKLIFVVEE